MFDPVRDPQLALILAVLGLVMVLAGMTDQAAVCR
jgi:hypothetical protein